MGALGLKTDEDMVVLFVMLISTHPKQNYYLKFYAQKRRRIRF